MKIYLTLIALLFLLLSCSESTDVNYDDEISIIENMNIKDAINQANEWRSSHSKITSYITTEQLTIEFPDGREVTKKLPDNEMYIAVAPYINTTHTCSNHYISTCDAELKNKTFNVLATIDNSSIINENFTSMNNGFIELWLPRNKTITILVEYGNLKSSETISTSKNSKTCYTTFYLK